MGKLFLINLYGNVYSCKFCEAHLALKCDIISKSFNCKNGKAYLMDKVHKVPRHPYSVNVTCGEKQDCMMMTGMHTVVDIFCLGCGCNVGWKYESAHDTSQKYKEGKYVMDRSKVVDPDGSLYSTGKDAQLG